MNHVRKVFVTGGAQGIGKALSKAFLLQGSKVCIADVNANVGSRTRDELQSETKNNDVIFVNCDVTNEEMFKGAVETAVKEFDGINVFVNNAGIIDEKNWTKCVEVNQNGVIRGTMLALEHMRKDKGGHGGIVVNISSMAGLIPIHATPTYSATKSAVISYTSAVAASPEQKHSDVNLVCLCPAFAETAIIYPEDSKVLDLPYMKALVKKIGILKVDTVVEAFFKLIEDNINGSVLSVTTRGSQYYSRDEKGFVKLENITNPSS